MVRRLLHRIAHLLACNYGTVETWREPDCVDGKLMVGFRCSGCGKLSGVSEVNYDLPSRTPQNNS